MSIKFVQDEASNIEVYLDPAASHEDMAWLYCADRADGLIRFIKFATRRFNRGIAHKRHPKRKARRVNGRLRKR